MSCDKRPPQNVLEQRWQEPASPDREADARQQLRGSRAEIVDRRILVLALALRGSPLLNELKHIDLHDNEL